jgi:hypothetical protein
MTYTGAPLALYALGVALQRRGMEPVVLGFGDGPLRAYFERAGMPCTDGISVADVEFAITNSLATLPVAASMVDKGIRVATWLHESRYYLDLMNFDLVNSGADRVHMILVPAQFQIAEFQAMMPGLNLFQMRNTVSQPHFRLTPDTGAFAVTGSWEDRKGQARLVELFTETGLPSVIDFIGATYSPDMVFPGNMEARFPGKIHPDEARTRIAASLGVISCAAAEVQPLSTLEGLLAGRPALLSDIPAHREMAGRFRNVFIFDAASSQSFRTAFAGFKARIDDLAGAAYDAQLGRNLFGVHTFDARVGQLVDHLLGKDGPEGPPPRLQD